MILDRIIIDDVEYLIQYQSTKLGDKILDKNSNTIYEASLHDIDDLNWIVIDKKHLKMNNIAIECLNLKQGKKILEYFKSLGFYRSDFTGIAYNNLNNRYYGVINGKFDVYCINYIVKNNTSIITLPEEQSWWW